MRERVPSVAHQSIPTELGTLGIHIYDKSLYEAEESANKFETELIQAITGLPNIRWWHRNIARTGFAINGFINHYPDFIVRTRSGKIVIIETKSSTSSESSAFARHGEARARKGYAKTDPSRRRKVGASPNSKPEPCFCAIGNKLQETRNNMPSASVYLLENLHFLQFFVADSVPGSIILCKGD